MSAIEIKAAGTGGSGGNGGDAGFIRLKIEGPQVTEAVNNTIHPSLSITPEEAETTSLAERVKMLELAVNFVSQQNFPQDADQTYGMLIAKAMRGKESKTLKPLCPTCGKTYAFGGVCRDYFHQPSPVRDII